MDINNTCKCFVINGFFLTFAAVITAVSVVKVDAAGLAFMQRDAA